MLDHIKLLWDSFGEERMLTAWEELQQAGISSWKRSDDQTPELHDEITINGKKYIRAHVTSQPIQIQQQEPINSQYAHDVLKKYHRLYCPICQEIAYPESDCIACRTFICGVDKDHTFTINTQKKES